jgi:hypothetical protein
MLNCSPSAQDITTKIARLRPMLKKYQDKLAFKMKFYRGVIHESAASELKHAEVTVLQAMVYDLQQEIAGLEKQLKQKH